MATVNTNYVDDFISVTWTIFSFPIMLLEWLNKYISCQSAKDEHDLLGLYNITKISYPEISNFMFTYSGKDITI